MSHVPAVSAACADVHEELILIVDAVNPLLACRDVLTVYDNVVDNVVTSNDADVMVRGEVIAD
jgi:hypothetical protein